jgi:hypothetical protein
MLGDPCRLSPRCMSLPLARHVAQACVTCRLAPLTLSPGFAIQGDNHRDRCRLIPRSQATSIAMHVVLFCHDRPPATRCSSPLLAIPVVLSRDPCRPVSLSMSPCLAIPLAPPRRGPVTMRKCGSKAWQAPRTVSSFNAAWHWVSPSRGSARSSDSPSAGPRGADRRHGRHDARSTRHRSGWNCEPDGDVRSNRLRRARGR